MQNGILKLIDLPLIMVAPNGARRTTNDHPAIPVTAEQLARVAAECYEAGAGAIHIHVRDENQKHVLDADLYRAATEAIDRETNGKMLVQITTEAVGHYSPQQQRDVVKAVMPQAVSIALGEMIPDVGEEQNAAELYGFLLNADVAVQHIIYDVEGIERFADFVRRGIVPGDQHSLLFPLGRYTEGQQSDPQSLLPFLAKLDEQGLRENCEWAVCAFGVGETRSLVAAMAFGGKVRVGFENNLHHADGSLAANNTERLAAISVLASAMWLE